MILFQAMSRFGLKILLCRTLFIIFLGTSWKSVAGSDDAFSPTSKEELTDAVQGCVKGRLIDAAIHLWSDGNEPFPWANAPPPHLDQVATAESYIARAREAGVAGALIVQPANHMYDHKYVTKVLKDHPNFFRGMGLANPTLPVSEAVSELEALHASGFVGVRFNAAHFSGGIGMSAVGRALYLRAGQLGMPVGILAFNGLKPLTRELEGLCTIYPSTKLIIDHLGLFRQPAIGGQIDTEAENQEDTWNAVLSLAKHRQVYVKVSALFRNSAELPPFADLAPKLKELLKVYGADRLMWGSDYPYAITGGFPLPSGVTSTPAAQSYDKAVQVIDEWALPELDSEAREMLMGGTAAKLFGF